ncbi:MAG TPA: hypothetical protein VFS76_03745 [Pyrinomonadaceae bacterium]|nr:hypothetical protein [Pyrinomonadaceae bacterium]
MKTLERRSFLSLLSHAAVGSALFPVSPFARTFNQTNNRTCWLDVCAPFIIQDSSLGIESEIVLTSDNFIGARGYEDGADATEYEIYLYDFEGHAVGENGVAKCLTASAMRNTVIPVSELVGPNAHFCGGMKVRLRPRTRTPSHASDLFSSAFVRWKSRDSFTNVHANPDPLQWQRADSFFYSMPFPPLDDYDCIYSIFNPYAEHSAGALTLYDPFGATLKEMPYELNPHSSVLVDLRKGEYTRNLDETFNPRRSATATRGGMRGGTIAITNRQGSVKNFGYMLIKHSDGKRFSIEHPIHQPPYNPTAARVPFDDSGRFKAQNILYTPLVFRSKKIGGVTLDSRFHFSSGAPVEEALWLNPFITDADGKVAWQTGDGSKLPGSIPEQQIERGAIKLRGQQSCIFDCRRLEVPKGFSGGLSLAITPLSNHTLMKVEVVAEEWNARAFTHFRPGLAAARAYQKPVARAGLGTDYIVAGARLSADERRIIRDEIIAVINIDDKHVAGNPTLEVFTSAGLKTRVRLGEVPAFGCRHYLLSALVSEKIGANDLSLRLVDEQATLLMSVLHLDYERRDIAADHGSDRFSTFAEFTCDLKA